MSARIEESLDETLARHIESDVANRRAAEALDDYRRIAHRRMIREAQAEALRWAAEEYAGGIGVYWWPAEAFDDCDDPQAHLICMANRVELGEVEL